MKKLLLVLGYILLWILFSPAFIFLVVRKKEYSRVKKILLSLSTIVSPFTIMTLAIVYFYLALMPPKEFEIIQLENSLAIHLKDDCDIKKNKIEYHGQDYTAEVELRFSERAVEDLTRQIEATAFFNQGKDFLEGVEAGGKDSILYGELLKHLKTHHLTGYWISDGPGRYKFYQPPLSDIPNAALLFGEGYEVYADFDTGRGRLHFKYIKI